MHLPRDPKLTCAACWLAILWAFTTPGTAAEPAPNPDRQRAALETLLKILPRGEPWEQWLASTGELPPDIAQWNRSPFLPDPLRLSNGRAVTRSTWLQRRRELMVMLQHYILGEYPPFGTEVTPATAKVREETAAVMENVLLEFGPEKSAKLRIELMIPKGEGPFPVFLAPRGLRSWARVGVSRGYAACLYAADDTDDDSALWDLVWPGAQWTRLTRRAWAASRCVDYLVQSPFLDAERIAVVGHGASAAPALVAAAFDQRLAAVVVSSPEAGGPVPFRFHAETEYGPGIERVTRQQWGLLSPRLRFFAAQPSYLPVDQHSLLSLVAPRPCLVAVGLHDPQVNLWGLEQSIRSARRAYQLNQSERALTLHYRPAGAEVESDEVETCFDWLDTAFGRGYFPFPDPTWFPTFESWERLVPEPVDPDTFPSRGLNNPAVGPDGTTPLTPAEWWGHRGFVRDRVFSTLGTSPPFAGTARLTEPEPALHQTVLLQRVMVPSDLLRQRLQFANHLSGDLYYRPLTNRQDNVLRPAIVWLHPLSTATGYVPPFADGEPMHLELARRGFVVLAFDQIGSGSRMREVGYFYNRYPEWTLLGKQIDDAMAAVEALGGVDFVDTQRIFLAGYHLGAKVALHAAALDDKVAGVICIGGVTPMRRDTVEKGTGGLARWTRWLPLQPYLASFIGMESHVPYDLHELLALMAPRPALLFAPRWDDQADLEDVMECAKAAAPVYELLERPGALQLHVLEDFNRLSPASKKAVADQLVPWAAPRLVSPPAKASVVP